MTTIKRLCNGIEKDIYYDSGLYDQITNYVIPDVQKKDFDYLYIVDGEERAGKSVFAMQLAKLVDPNFNIHNICFTPTEFIKAVTHANKYSAIVFDEAFTGLSSRSSLSEINNLLVSLMMEMGQRNLFIFIVMPTFFMLDKYVALHRSKGLFHIYFDNGKRGQWGFYRKDSLKYLYHTGYKYMDYTKTRSSMFGRFYDQYVIDEVEYRKLKSKALNSKKNETKAVKYLKQRDLLIYLMIERYNLSFNDLTKLINSYKDKSGWYVTRNNINIIYLDICRNMFGKEIDEEQDIEPQNDLKNEEEIEN